MSEKIDIKKLQAEAKKMLESQAKAKDLAKHIEAEKKKVTIRAKALDELPE